MTKKERIFRIMDDKVTPFALAAMALAGGIGLVAGCGQLMEMGRTRSIEKIFETGKGIFKCHPRSVNGVPVAFDADAQELEVEVSSDKIRKFVVKPYTQNPDEVIVPAGEIAQQPGAREELKNYAMNNYCREISKLGY